MNKDVDRKKASEDLELDELRRLEDLEKQASERATIIKGTSAFRRALFMMNSVIMGNLTVQHWYPVFERARFEKQTI